VDSKGTDLDIWTYEVERAEKTIYLVIAFQGKQSKPLYHYSYRTEAERDRRIADTIRSRTLTLDMKKKRQEEKKNFVHGLEVGSVLYSSWGYDQTNVNFYEVTDVKGKQVILRPIGKKTVKDDGYSASVIASPGKFTCTAIRRTPSGSTPSNVSVKINSSQYASLWDGRPKHESGSFGGH